MLNNMQLLAEGEEEGQRKKEEGQAAQGRPGQNGVEPQQLPWREKGRGQKILRTE